MGPLKFVGFCFLLLGALGAGYHYSNFASPASSAAFGAAPGSPADAVPAAGSRPDAAAGDQFCAILTMPQSLLPLLERLKRNRLARQITITPARIEKDRRGLVAVAEGGASAARTTARHTRAAGTTAAGPLGAMAVYVLAGAQKERAP